MLPCEVEPLTDRLETGVGVILPLVLRRMLKINPNANFPDHPFTMPAAPRAFRRPT